MKRSSKGGSIASKIGDIQSPLKGLEIDIPDANGQGPETVRRGKKRGGEKKHGHGDPS